MDTKYEAQSISKFGNFYSGFSCDSKVFQCLKPTYEPDIVLVENYNYEDAQNQEIIVDISEVNCTHDFRNCTSKATADFEKNDTPIGALEKCDDISLTSNAKTNKDAPIYYIKTKYLKRKKNGSIRPKKVENRNDHSDYSLSMLQSQRLELYDFVSIVQNQIKKRRKKNEGINKIMINRITGAYSLQKQSDKRVNSELLMKINNSIMAGNNSFDQSYLVSSNESQVIRPTYNNGEIHQTLLSEDLPITSTNQGSIELVESSNLCYSNNSTKYIYWQEGNIDKVSDPICLSKKLKEKYSYLSISGTSLEDCTAIQETNLRKVFSWQSVKERIHEIEEKMCTKFIFDYKSPNFHDDPKPFKRVYYELNTTRRKVSIMIPKTGMPFIFLGVYIFSCHLGAIRKSTDKNESWVVPNSKKIGCPAIISIARVARFPDFDVNGLVKEAESEALSEFNYAWDFNDANVRFYFEYYIRECKLEDHVGHELEKNVNNRFREPVDLRILNKVREIVRGGVVKAKEVQSVVKAFIETQLFQGLEVPSDRRRYNPTCRDIQYAIKKAKDELKKERTNSAQDECIYLVEEIVCRLRNVNDEQHLTGFKQQLANIVAKLNKINGESEAPIASRRKKMKFEPGNQETSEGDEINDPIFEQTTTQDLYSYLPVTMASNILEKMLLVPV